MGTVQDAADLTYLGWFYVISHTVPCVSYIKIIKDQSNTEYNFDEQSIKSANSLLCHLLFLFATQDGTHHELAINVYYRITSIPAYVKMTSSFYILQLAQMNLCT